MSRGSYRFGRALNITFSATGNVLGAAADFLIGPGFGNSSRAAGNLLGAAAQAVGGAGWMGAELVAGSVRNRTSRALAAEAQAAADAGDVHRMCTAAERFVSREPQEAIGHAWLAAACSGLGRHDQARAAADRAADLGLGVTRSAELRGRIAVAEGDFAAAVREFTTMATDPDHRAEALTARAAAFIELGRIDEAIDDADAALAAAESAEAHFVRAIARRVRGDLRGCHDDLDRAERLAPDVVDILTARAEVRAELGMVAEAAADRATLAAIELLAYLATSGVLVSLSPNRLNLELRGASVGSATMSRIAELKQELIRLLSNGPA